MNICIDTRVIQRHKGERQNRMQEFVLLEYELSKEDGFQMRTFVKNNG